MEKKLNAFWRSGEYWVKKIWGGEEARVETRENGNSIR